MWLLGGKPGKPDHVRCEHRGEHREVQEGDGALQGQEEGVEGRAQEDHDFQTVPLVEMHLPLAVPEERDADDEGPGEPDQHPVRAGVIT